MSKFLEKTFKDTYFVILVTLFIAGPLGRTLSVLVANQTVLTYGRISITYFIFTIFISIISIFFITYLTSIGIKSKKILIKTLSYLFFAIFTFTSLGSFFSSFSFLGKNNLIYVASLFVIILVAYMILKKGSLFILSRIKFLLVLSIFFCLISSYTILLNLKNTSSKGEIQYQNNNSNVLLILFDEMSFSYFLDDDESIPNFMPNLQNLAGRSTVFNSVSTTYPFTDLAIPSILAGKTDIQEYAKSGKVIELYDSPLVLIENTHQIFSNSKIVDVCKYLTCALETNNKSSLKLWTLDYFAILGNVLPNPFSNFFPSLDGTWQNYWEIGIYENKEDSRLFQSLVSGVFQSLDFTLDKESESWYLKNYLVFTDEELVVQVDTSTTNIYDGWTVNFELIDDKNEAHTINKSISFSENKKLESVVKIPSNFSTVNIQITNKNIDFNGNSLPHIKMIHNKLIPDEDNGNWFYFYHDLVTHHPWNLDNEGAAITPKSNSYFGDDVFGYGYNRFPSCLDGTYCSDDRVSLVRESYKNGLIEADRRIGNIIDKLIKTNQFDSTLIIITSDHGIILDKEGDGRRRNSISMLRPLAHVPLIIKYPNQIDSKINNEIKSTGQIVYTILEELGAGDDILSQKSLDNNLIKSSTFSTENGDIVANLQDIFSIPKPSKTALNLEIKPWIFQNFTEDLSSKQKILPKESILGYGYNFARKGASEVAVMFWKFEKQVCLDEIYALFLPTNTVYETLYDFKNEVGIIWSLVVREKNLKVEDFELICNN